jgi:hypothetical protein
MAIIADSGAGYRLYYRRDSFHAAIRTAVESVRDRIVLLAPTLGEIIICCASDWVTPRCSDFCRIFQEGAFVVESLTAADLRRCAALISKYDDLDLGLSDASAIAVAERLGTDRILTVDQRDFRVIRSVRGKAFRLLPADVGK